MKIVIIEDEIRIREGLSRLIEKLSPDYEVSGIAENGQEGYELVQKIKPDVVVTDIKMPLMDGLEMLTALYEDGYTGKAVVLSAYSEFEYARQAMRLGVKEYLLKPIVVTDISEALHHVREEIQQESMQEGVSIGELDQIFGGILRGSLPVDESVRNLLLQKYNLPEEKKYIEFCVYLGRHFEKNKDAAGHEVERMLEMNGGFRWICLESERDKMLVFLIYDYDDGHMAERFIQREMLRRNEQHIFECAAWNGNLSLENLRNGLADIRKYMEWNISLGDEVLISYPKVTELQTSLCIYPIEIEGQMKIHLCANDSAAVEKDMEDFEDFFKKGMLYAPREIKECYVRFLWAVMNVAKETGMLDTENLEQQTLLEQIMAAKTQRELRRVISSLMEKISRKEEDDTVHLTVKRAQSLIQEFYQTGITLDEIAAKLNITPEYLGTRFHKELGVNFSTYMKNFRMAKAKEMLIGTQLKLKEIAAQVGYADPKYFSKVFKETTGQLPADYRKTHK